MYSGKLQGTLLNLALLACLCALSLGIAQAQGKQAVIILRTTETGASSCDGQAQLSYQIITGPKVNNQEEVRLLTFEPGASAASAVSRKGYEGATKTRLKDLVALKWNQDGLLYGSTGNVQLLAVPNEMKPQKDTTLTLSSFYGVNLTGEIREGKKKRQTTIPLRSVWKIYFVTEGATINDTLFKHAAEENSVALWEAYLKTTGNYRADEARNLMHDALLVCARSDLSLFRSGDYGANARASERASRALSIRTDETGRGLLAEIQKAKETVDALRAQAEKLINDSKWDDGITATEPIKIYLDTWPPLKERYTYALQQSHTQHLFTGSQALKSNQIEIALRECSIAWQRVSTSAPARQCMCESRTLVTLRDEKNLRGQRHPKEAKLTLEKELADADCTHDARLEGELRVTNCEYAQQLWSEAQQLMGGSGLGRAAAATVNPRVAGRRRASATLPVQRASVGLRVVNTQNRQSFREARAKLLEAHSLCGDNSGVSETLEAANRSLSDYCLTEARRALGRGAVATAYTYLQSAQTYTPNDQALHSLLEESREKVREQTRVNIGVVIDDRSRSGSGANEIASEMESVAGETRLASTMILGREQAASALRSIQSGRQLSAPTVIFYGDLLNAGAHREDNRHTVRSSYSYENPDWKNADRVHDDLNRTYKDCKKVNGEAGCASQRADVERARAYRDQFRHYVEVPYEYEENTITLRGAAQMSFRAVDSISRSTQVAETLEATVSGQCVERSGVRSDDRNRFAGAADSSCNVADEGTYVSQMIAKIKRDAHLRAAAYLQQLPQSYYARGQSAANRQQAVEDYLFYLFLTRDKTDQQADSAMQFISAFDPELKSDGTLR
jgi:hypothetical protein